MLFRSTGKFQDQIVETPDEEFGKDVLAWLREGQAVEVTRTKEHLLEFGKPLGLNGTQIGEALKSAELDFDPTSWEKMTSAVLSYANVSLR